MSNVKTPNKVKVNIMENVTKQSVQHILGFSVWGIPDFFKQEFSQNLKKAS